MNFGPATNAATALGANAAPVLHGFGWTQRPDGTWVRTPVQPAPQAAVPVEFVAQEQPAAEVPAPEVAQPVTPPSKDNPAPADKAPVWAPADLLPIYQAASKRTGIPVEVLLAQAKQESDFNVNAVGSAGEIGLHQIKPSTASEPGFGMQGIDPSSLKNPVVNINFAADYLKARAGKGADFSNPSAVDVALKNFNGGGDPNYVANVRRYATSKPADGAS
jgi:soluble lytic murein transglycosylase-like protein